MDLSIDMSYPPNYPTLKTNRVLYDMYNMILKNLGSSLKRMNTKYNLKIYDKLIKVREDVMITAETNSKLKRIVTCPWKTTTKNSDIVCVVNVFQRISRYI
ncbi:hypothetical protein RF11_12442 [Thelohanellus kitauei]|uniref:Uncharacterized protein n=1 Tax=Thelohanellus kitauei TaxID=669202 RepID=A0A0C2JQW4_THEKT|nr:hypothetical protein RF11_12442 [Thelohanellus kitauei]